MAGYEGAPVANQPAFTNGWFRTGDQGFQDADGYFFITGRIKELINRGGEKISPREVDEALLSHPAVAQAVAFAVPHARLGEDVGAAVVLRAGASATERGLRQFTLARLAPHKVPSQVIFVDEVPKGPTGKPQRIGLHKTLAPLLHRDFIAPAGPVEEAVARIWSEVLEAGRIGMHDNFFFLGGDSLLATRVVARLRSTFDVEFPLETMFHGPTIAEQALVLEEIILRKIEGIPDAERA
jgi:acyl carrier protein